MNRIDQFIIENITEAMRQKGWTQKRLASEANMDPVQLNRIMKGKKKAGTISLGKIATAVGWSIEAFYRERETESPKLALIGEVLRMSDTEAANLLRTLRSDADLSDLDDVEMPAARRRR